MFQDSRPPFDIHEYGEVVLERLSLGEDESLMSFTDVVKGREKHDIARTFSALLQLVSFYGQCMLIFLVSYCFILVNCEITAAYDVG